MALPLWRSGCISIGLCVLGVLTLLSQSYYHPRSSPDLSAAFRAPSLFSAPTQHLEAVDRLSQSMAKVALGFALDPLPWRVKNEQVLARLIKCQMLDNCSKKEREIVILRCDHFANVKNGIFNRRATGPAGEGIWADSLIWALETLGHPYIVIPGPGVDYSNGIMSQVYNLLQADNHDSVKMVIADYISLPRCIHASNCMATPAYPEGIPFHKIFTWNGFCTLHGEHRYGAPFALTFFPCEPHHDQPTQNFTFIGLTLEQHCSKFNIVPLAERENKAYILGKLRSYFFNDKRAWALEYWDKAQEELGDSFRFEAGTTGDLKNSDLPPLPSMIQDIGTSERETFFRRIGESRVMIGMGRPEQSSSPLEALCMGVPFINPVFLRRDKEKNPPSHEKGLSEAPYRESWFSQHRYLQNFDEPYVYNVDVDDYYGFVKAIKTAIKTPIEPFIPEQLQMKTYLARVDELIHRDWKAVADLQEATGEIRTF